MFKTKATVSVERFTSFYQTAESCLFIGGDYAEWI